MPPSTTDDDDNNPWTAYERTVPHQHIVTSSPDVPPDIHTKPDPTSVYPDADADADPEADPAITTSNEQTPLMSSSSSPATAGMIPSSDPLVRQALALIRLQVLTPLSVLVSIGANLVCAIVVRPTMGEISKDHPTSLTPLNLMIGIYWLILWVGLIGYCVLLVIARKEETKATIVSGVGLRFVLANWLLAFWGISWALQLFLVSTILLALNILLLGSIFVTLLYYPPHLTRPLDYLLIHAPMRLMLMITLLLGFPQSLFVTLDWVDKLHAPEGGGDVEWGKWAWPAFGFIVGLNTIGLINVAWRRDLVWVFGGVWIVLSIGLARPKPAPVFAAVILFTVLYPLTWIAAFAWSRLRKGEEEGRIVLPPDEEEGTVQPTEV